MRSSRELFACSIIVACSCLTACGGRQTTVHHGGEETAAPAEPAEGGSETGEVVSGPAAPLEPGPAQPPPDGQMNLTRPLGVPASRRASDPSTGHPRRSATAGVTGSRTPPRSRALERCPSKCAVFRGSCSGW